jgi:hypothetical protein
MMVQRRVIWLIAVVAISIGACSQPGASPTSGALSSPVGSSAPQTQAPGSSAPQTQAAGTPITNADGTVTDADGFVRFPGEPTRPDQSHYYVIEDICGQFTQPFMERLAGMTFKEIRPSGNTATYLCSYYTSTKAADGKDVYILLVLDYLSVADQKAGQQALGRTVASNADIPMDNFVATQENGVINAIYLVLGPEKFLRLDRSSTSALSDAKMVALAIKLGAKMKDFK